MYIEQYKEVLKTFIESDVPLFVWGPGGIGKSQVTEAVAKDLGYHLVDLRLATQEVGDLIGIPCSVEREITRMFDDGRGGRVAKSIKTHETTWAAPSWVNTILEKDAMGIPTVIFADEMNRAPKEVVNAFYQVCTKKQIHEHFLPASCKLVAAGNPPTDEYMVDTFDNAMMTRWGHVYLDHSEQTWIEQFGPRCNQDIAGFILTHKGKLMHKAAAWDVGSIIRPTPRGWELADRVYRTISARSGGLDKIHLQICLGAIIGGTGAHEFVLDLDKDWIKVEDILSGNATMKDIKKASDANIKLLRLNNDITQYMTYKDITKDGSLKKATIDERKERLEDFLAAMVDERKELVIAAAKIIGSRDKDLFRIFLSKNAKLSACVKELTSIMRQSIGY